MTGLEDAFWLWMAAHTRCRECGLLKVEAESIECRCDWPNGKPRSGMTGYIKPPNPDIAADYWVTRRSADAAPGYDLGLPDIRVRYRWNGRDAWITGYHESQRREADLGCLHSNNGWRIERLA